jgi:hypothetical protein
MIIKRIRMKYPIKIECVTIQIMRITSLKLERKKKKEIHFKTKVKNHKVRRTIE